MTGRPLARSSSGDVFNEPALTTLLVAAAAMAMDAPPGIDLTVDQARNTIATLVLHSALLGRLMRGHDEGGREGLLAELETARTAGELSWAAASVDPLDAGEHTVGRRSRPTPGPTGTRSPTSDRACDDYRRVCSLDVTPRRR